MSNELIPKDSAQAIIQQVFADIHEALQTQTEISKQQLLQLMVECYIKALREYIDITAKKLYEFTPKNE